jgi:hypothetical protein
VFSSAGRCFSRGSRCGEATGEGLHEWRRSLFRVRDVHRSRCLGGRSPGGRRYLGAVIFGIALRGPRWLTPAMRRVALTALLVLSSTALSACTQSFASRIDERTFRIEGPEIPGGSDVPNQRTAAKLCPRGYRVLDESRHKTDYQSGLVTYWTVRCL